VNDTLERRNEVLSGYFMVAKCSNPSCSAHFFHLEEGSLFRLEKDPAFRSSKEAAAEYFWLCLSCSSTMTLHIDNDGKVIPLALPAPVHDVSEGSGFILAQRHRGLFLSRLSFSGEKHRRGR